MFEKLKAYMSLAAAMVIVGSSVVFGKSDCKNISGVSGLGAAVRHSHGHYFPLDRQKREFASGNEKERLVRTDHHGVLRSVHVYGIASYRLENDLGRGSGSDNQHNTGRNGVGNLFRSEGTVVCATMDRDCIGSVRRDVN